MILLKDIETQDAARPELQTYAQPPILGQGPSGAPACHVAGAGSGGRPERRGSLARAAVMQAPRGPMLARLDACEQLVKQSYGMAAGSGRATS